MGSCLISLFLKVPNAFAEAEVLVSSLKWCAGKYFTKEREKHGVGGTCCSAAEPLAKLWPKISVHRGKDRNRRRGQNFVFTGLV